MGLLKYFSNIWGETTTSEGEDSTGKSAGLLASIMTEDGSGTEGADTIGCGGSGFVSA